MERKIPEQLYWRHVFGGSEERAENPDKESEKHFGFYGFWKGKIWIPSLNLRVKLTKGEFYLFKEVEDLARSIDLIHIESEPDEPENIKGAHYLGYYKQVDYREKSIEAILNIVLVRKNITDLDRIVAESYENGHFLESTGRNFLVYNSYQIPGETRLEISSHDNFPDLCKIIGMHNYLRSMKKVEAALLEYEKFGMHRNKRIVEIARKLFKD